MKKTVFFAALLVAVTFSAYSHDNCELINSPDKKPLTITVETPGTLLQQLADYYKTEITELTVIGNLNDEDYETLKNLPNLAVLDMENANLEVLPSFKFSGTSLTSVKLPKTLKAIESYAFSKCSRLTSVTIPDGVTSIEMCAFSDCIRLTSITIPSSVTSIGNWAFSSCWNLTSITIPDGVTEIGYSAFQDCSNLTSITISDGVTSIEDFAFYCCRSLTSIYCKAMTPPSVCANTLRGVSTMLTLYVPIGSKTAYATADGWKYFRIIETQF